MNVPNDYTKPSKHTPSGDQSEKLQWKKPKERPILRDEAYYGLAGDLVRLLCDPQPPHTKPCTEADRAAILFSLITAIGNIIGSDAHIEMGGSNHPPNLYTLIVGGSGKGRKGTSFWIISDLLKLVDPTWFSFSKKSGFASGEALIAEYAEKEEEDENATPPDKDSDGEREKRLKKRLFIREPEFSRPLGTSGREGNNISEVWRIGWDESRLENRRSQEKVIATDVHISILAHITAEELIEKLPAGALTNGFVNRFVMCFSQRPKKVARPPKPDPKEIERFAEAIRDRISRMRYAPIDLSEKAWELYEETYLARPESDGPLGAITVRAEVQCLRIAINFAILDSKYIIEPQHLKAAYAMWDYSVASFEYVFGDLMEDPIQARIMEVLIDIYPQGLTKNEILNRIFSRHLKGGVTEPIKALEAAGRVRVESEPAKVQKGDGKARPATRVFAVYPPPDPRDLSELSEIRVEEGLNSHNSLKSQAPNPGKSEKTPPTTPSGEARVTSRNGKYLTLRPDSAKVQTVRGEIPPWQRPGAVMSDEELLASCGREVTPEIPDQK
jgi:hypothetical protein